MNGSSRAEVADACMPNINAEVKEKSLKTSHR